MLARLAELGDTPAAKRPRALVLVPTRELAFQVVDSLQSYAAPLRLSVRPAVGGTPFGRQADQLRRAMATFKLTGGVARYREQLVEGMVRRGYEAAFAERVFQQIKTAFLEDVLVFSAQQENIDLDPGAPQVDINADSGGIQARRIVAKLYADEQAAVAASVTAAE